MLSNLYADDRQYIQIYSSSNKINKKKIFVDFRLGLWALKNEVVSNEKHFRVDRKKIKWKIKLIDYVLFKKKLQV